MELIEISKINLKDINEPTVLPPNAQKELRKLSDTFITVYTKRSKTLRFFPAKNENIWWIRIAIRSFDPKTSGQILNHLNDLVEEFLFSTGVCISKEECFWDGVVLESSLKIDKDEIPESFKDIPNVKDVKVKKIE
jgi:hypothetical protein